MKHTTRILAFILSASLINLPMLQTAHAGMVTTEC